MLLIKEKCLIDLRIDQHESFITTLIAIDADKNKLLFDSGPKDYLNKQVPNASHITFSTVVAGIKVRFEGKDIENFRFNGEAVFSMTIPEKMQWLQRRQFYRVKSPLSKASYLQLVIEDTAIQFPLYDISLSGFSFLNDTDSINHLLPQFRTIPDGKLILDGIGEDTVGFEILNRNPLNPNKPDKTQKVGCKFTSLTPAFESGIQRYMQQIERELKQKN